MGGLHSVQSAARDSHLSSADSSGCWPFCLAQGTLVKLILLVPVPECQVVVVPERRRAHPFITAAPLLTSTRFPHSPRPSPMPPKDDRRQLANSGGTDCRDKRCLRPTVASASTRPLCGTLYPGRAGGICARQTVDSECSLQKGSEGSSLVAGGTGL